MTSDRAYETHLAERTEAYYARIEAEQEQDIDDIAGDLWDAEPYTSGDAA